MLVTLVAQVEKNLNEVGYQENFSVVLGTMR